MQWSCPLERVGKTHLLGRHSSDDGKESLAGNTGRNSIPTIRKHTGSYRRGPLDSFLCVCGSSESNSVRYCRPAILSRHRKNVDPVSAAYHLVPVRTTIAPTG